MKKACRTCWLNLYAGLDAAFDQYKRHSTNLTGDPTWLLKKTKGHDFFGILYLLKYISPNLSVLSKTFQVGSENFSRIRPSINCCKTKIQEINKNWKVWDKFEKDLGGRLKHCLNRVHVRIFFWSLFFLIRTEYGDLSVFSQKARKYGPEKLRVLTLFTQSNHYTYLNWYPGK